MRSAPRAKSGSKLIRLLGVIVLVAMTCIPPWQLRYSLNGQKQVVSAGYHPIWNPPAEEVEIPEGAADPAHRINVIRLSIQLLVVLVLMNGCLLLLKKSEPEN